MVSKSNVLPNKGIKNKKNVRTAAASVNKSRTTRMDKRQHRFYYKRKLFILKSMMILILISFLLFLYIPWDLFFGQYQHSFTDFHKSVKTVVDKNSIYLYDTYYLLACRSFIYPAIEYSCQKIIVTSTAFVNLVKYVVSHFMTRIVPLIIYRLIKTSESLLRVSDKATTQFGLLTPKIAVDYII
ncbi:hypothetical protein HZS_878 [Henneguya salminicola]|nr:hypothetical protein HZS_878 [Henneguya salminicola]